MDANEMDDPRMEDPKKSWREFPGYNHAVRLLRHLDDCLANARYYQYHLKKYIEEDPQRLQFWEQFLASGGVTAKDLSRWHRGEEIRPGVKRKKHLRLVSSSIPRRRLRLPRSGGEAA